MGKLLLLALAVWLIFVILKRYRSSLQPSSRSNSTAEDMVECATCGLHLPKSDSVQRDNQYYCCAAHIAQRTHEQ